MNGIEWTFEMRFAIALLLGFLVGLERESTKLEQQKLVFGGVRTHPIISMYGFGCAWLHKIGASLVLPVGLLSIIVLTAIAYLAKTRNERYGSTSEMSALLTFIVGASALLLDVWVAMALGIVNTMLLSEKSRLEKFVEDLDRVDFLATIKFLLVTVIILPVLPNQEYTQFRLNPSSIWKIVILVSTIGFFGYVLAKRFGSKVGLWLSGVLGGIVSSTALTVAAGRMAEKTPTLSRSAMQAAILASSVMYLRILALIAFINPSIIPFIWWRLLLLSAVGIALAVSVGRHEAHAEPEEMPLLENPFEISPAIWFAGLFVALTVVTSIVQSFAGSTGLLTLASIVGVTDIDPFILSLVRNPDTLIGIAERAILLAMMSNTVVKGAYFSFLVPATRRESILRFGIWAALHLPLVFVEPF